MRLIMARMVWTLDISAAVGLDEKEKELDWAKQKTWVLAEKKPFEAKMASVRQPSID